MVKLAASLMCVDYLNIAEDIAKLEKAGLDYFHIDIMDGHFVPNLAMNFDMVHTLKKHSKTPLDLHLMVDNPQNYVDKIVELEVNMVSFHLASCRFPFRLSDQLRKGKCKVGIAINPFDNFCSLKYILQQVDFVTVMSVEPGFSGQKFLEGVFEKIAELHRMIKTLNLKIPIEVDGNIDKHTAKMCIERGASILVLGTSSIFKKDEDLLISSRNFKKYIQDLGDE